MSEDKKTSFEEVGEFHRAFGHPFFDKVQLMNVMNSKLMDLRVKLIEEEFNELCDAIHETQDKVKVSGQFNVDDIVEIVDALGDITYVVNGFAHVLGVNLDDISHIVHRCNMTKLCETEEEAIESCRIYREKFEAGKSPYEKVNYRRSPDEKYWVVYDESNGKILKSHKFRDPHNEIREYLESKQ